MGDSFHLWAWKLIKAHLWATHSRPAIRWMNRFAFLGICIAVFSLISIMSVMNGLQSEIKKLHLEHKPHYLWESSPQALDEKKLEKIIQELFGSELKSLSFILQSEGLLEKISAQSGRIQGRGVVLQGLKDFKGQGLHAGVELADLMSLMPQEKVLLRSPWKLEAPPLELEVNNFFKSGLYEVDQNTLRMSRDELEAWLGIPGAISRIEIQIHSPYKVDEYIDRLKQGTQLEFQNWKKFNGALWYSLKLEKTVMFLAAFFVVLLATLSLNLSLSIRVSEKFREIALLNTLGAPKRSLYKLYLIEGASLGILASLIGFLMAYFFCVMILQKQFVQFPAIFYSTEVPVEWNWGLHGLIVILTALMSVLASFMPAKKVLRVEIAEALRS